jgi:hypothetical protein
VGRRRSWQRFQGFCSRSSTSRSCCSSARPGRPQPRVGWWLPKGIVFFFGGTLVGLVALDLVVYWWHRARHAWTPLWPLHQLHHSGERLDAVGAARLPGPRPGPRRSAELRAGRRRALRTPSRRSERRRRRSGGRWDGRSGRGLTALERAARNGTRPGAGARRAGRHGTRKLVRAGAVRSSPAKSRKIAPPWLFEIGNTTSPLAPTFCEETTRPR